MSHPRQSNFPQLLFDPLPHLRSLHAQLLTQRKRHIFEDRKRVEQRSALKEHRKPFPYIVQARARQARDFHIVNPYLTTIRLHEPDDVLEEHTLSRSTACLLYTSPSPRDS